MLWENNILPIITLEVTKGNAEVSFTALQKWMFLNIHYLESLWWAIWVTTLCVLVWKTVVKKEFQ